MGAGPAGLMAAHAAAVTNNDVFIVSKKRKSYMRGAQYLHMPIPMYSKQPFMINYGLEGTPEGYRDKVYGPDPRIRVSPESLVGQHFAWDIREAYDGLWNTYGMFIREDTEITPDSFPRILEDCGADLVISSVPAPVICRDGTHVFQSESVWVTEQSKFTMMDNVVTCSGDPDHPWYRQSRIQGWENTEYPFSKKPPLSEDKVHHVVKPIKTSCDCYPEVMRVGRYGTWTKGVLSHKAFYDVAHRLDNPEMEHNQ